MDYYAIWCRANCVNFGYPLLVWHKVCQHHILIIMHSPPKYQQLHEKHEI